MKIYDLDEAWSLKGCLIRYREAERTLKNPAIEFPIQVGAVAVETNSDVLDAIRRQIVSKRYQCEARLKALGVEIDR